MAYVTRQKLKLPKKGELRIKRIGNLYEKPAFIANLFCFRNILCNIKLSLF